LNINFVAIILILVSSVALLLSIRAFYQLYKMDLLGKNFWKESGPKNLFLFIIWILLLVSGIELLLENPEATNHIKISLGIFWVAIVLSWLQHVVAGVKVLFFNAPINFSETLDQAPFTKEILEKTAASLNQLDATDSSGKNFYAEMLEDSDGEFEDEIREELMKMVLGKTVGFLFISVILYLCLINL